MSKIFVAKLQEGRKWPKKSELNTQNEGKKIENQKLINWKIYDCLSYNQVRPSTQYYFTATIKQTNNTWTWGNITKKKEWKATI